MVTIPLYSVSRRKTVCLLYAIVNKQHSRVFPLRSAYELREVGQLEPVEGDGRRGASQVVPVARESSKAARCCELLKSRCSLCGGQHEAALGRAYVVTQNCFPGRFAKQLVAIRDPQGSALGLKHKYMVTTTVSRVSRIARVRDAPSHFSMVQNGFFGSKNY